MMSGQLVQDTDTEVSDRIECGERSWALRTIYGLLVAVQFIISSITVVMLKSPGDMLLASVVQLSGVAL